MTETVFEKFATAAATLKLDFSAMYFSPMAVRDSVRDAAANTVSSTVSAGVWVSSVLFLLPQATRLSAMTSASSREMNFFMQGYFLPFEMFVLSQRDSHVRITVFQMMRPRRAHRRLTCRRDRWGNGTGRSPDTIRSRRRR